MKKLLSIMFVLYTILSLISVAASATGSTKTINCGTFTIEISDIYAVDSTSKSSGDGYTTMYFAVVTDAAEIKCTKYDSKYPNEYLIWPCNSIVFTNGPLYPTVERACEYDDAKYVPFSLGTSVAVEEGNEYYFYGSTGGKNYGVRIFVVDAAKAASVGGVASPAPAPAASEPAEPPTTASEPASSAPATFSTPGATTSEPASSAPVTFATPGAAASEPTSSASATFTTPAPKGPETPCTTDGGSCSVSRGRPSNPALRS